MSELIYLPNDSRVIWWQEVSRHDGLMYAGGGAVLDASGISFTAAGLRNGAVEWGVDTDGRMYVSEGATESVAAAVARVYCHYCGVGQTPADPALCKCCGAALPRE